jgi:hypothetical protein
LRPLAGTFLALLLVAACGQQPGAVPSPSPRPSPSASAVGDPAAWQQKGATTVPPASIRDTGLGAVQVVNQTGGAVSDQDAARWARAYLRANAYEFWAWNGMQDAFLLRSGLSPVPTRAFAYDISTIQQARAAGARVQVTRLVLRRLVLRPVPQTLRDEIARQIFVYSPYAFYLDQVGPSDLSWIDGQGTRTSKARRDAGVGAPELVGGTLVSDPLMGDLWALDSDFDCTSTTVQRVFGTLCAP